MLFGFDTDSIGEPSARLADPSSGPATTAQGWGVSVIESGESPVIVTTISRVEWRWLRILGTVRRLARPALWCSFCCFPVELRSRVDTTSEGLSGLKLARSWTTVAKDHGTKGRRRRTADQVRPAFVECHRIPAGP